MGAFDNRAGRAGYDETGRAISGMAGSQSRDEDRRRIQGEKNVIRQAQKNARNALRSGDIKAWTEWNTAAGGVTSAIPSSEQLNRNAEARVFRNTNDAANLRPAGVAPQEQANAQQPAASNVATNNTVASAPPKGGLGSGAAGSGLTSGAAGSGLGNGAAGGGLRSGAAGSGLNNGKAPAGGVDDGVASAAPSAAADSSVPFVGPPAPSGTTEQSTRDALSGASSYNPYNLPSVDQENAKRAELEKQGAFGTKTKEFERFQDSKQRRSDADQLKEQYASGAMGKDEFMEKGMAIKGATKASLENIINSTEAVNSAEPPAKVADNRISDNNKRILDEARARGALDSRDPNYNPNDPKFSEAAIKKGASDTLDQAAFDQSQKDFNDKMLASESTKQNIDIFKQQILNPNSTPLEKAKATASLNKINDEILAKGTGVEAQQAQERLNNFKYLDNAAFDVNTKESKDKYNANARNARNAAAKRSMEIAARNQKAKAERKTAIDNQSQSMSYWMQF